MCKIEEKEGEGADYKLKKRAQNLQFT